MVAVLLLFLPPARLSALAAQVSARDVWVTPGKAVMLPVSVAGNEGLMGLRVTVNYDPAFLQRPTVTAAGVTASGLFNDSISTSAPGSFDVVWCTDADVKENGELFVLGFTVSENAAGSTQITFEFSEEETFNEQWQPVRLDLLPVTLTVGDDPGGAAAGQPRSKAELDGRGLVSVVETVLAEFDAPNLASVNEAEQGAVAARVGELAAQMNVPKSAAPKDFDSLSSEYGKAKSAVFLEEVDRTVDADEVQAALRDALAAHGFASAAEVPAQQAGAVLQSVLPALQQRDPDLVLDVSGLSEENAAALVNGLANLTAEDPPERGEKWLLPVVLILLIAIAAAVAIVFIKRKKRDKRHEEA